jgi:hypothetical protein
VTALGGVDAVPAVVVFGAAGGGVTDGAVDAGADLGVGGAATVGFWATVAGGTAVGAAAADTVEIGLAGEGFAGGTVFAGAAGAATVATGAVAGAGVATVIETHSACHGGVAGAVASVWSWRTWSKPIHVEDRFEVSSGLAKETPRAALHFVRSGAWFANARAVAN